MNDLPVIVKKFGCLVATVLALSVGDIFSSLAWCEAAPIGQSDQSSAADQSTTTQLSDQDKQSGEAEQSRKTEQSGAVMQQADFRGEQERLWNDFRHKYNQGGVSQAWESLDRFSEGCLAIGGCSDRYAGELLVLAEDLLDRDKYPLAKALTEKARVLSGNSALTTIKSGPLAYKFSLISFGQLLEELWTALLVSPIAQLMLLLRSFKLLIWAATLACLILILTALLTNRQRYLSSIGGYLHPAVKGVGALLLGLFAIALPVVFGPLWTLWLWALLLLIALPKFSKVAYGAAVLMLVWGYSIPAMQNMAGWVATDEGSSFLLAAEGQREERVIKDLEWLQDAMPGEALVAFYLARQYRHRGDYRLAFDQLAKAKRLYSVQHSPFWFSLLEEKGWLDVEQGIVLHLMGEKEALERHYATLESSGFSAAPFLYNYSKMALLHRFDLAKSNLLLAQARGKAPELVQRLQELDDRVGDDTPHSFAEMNPNLATILPLLIRHSLVENDGGKAVANALMPGLAPGRIRGMGWILLLITVILTNMRRTDPRPLFVSRYYAADSASLPGLRSVKASRPLMAWIMFFIIAIGALPLLNWLTDLVYFDSFWKLVTIIWASVFAVMSCCCIWIEERLLRVLGDS